MSTTPVVTIEFGSHLYGTSTPASDRDYKSVHLPSARNIILQQVSEAISHKRQKSFGEKNTPENIDQQSYSLQYFLKLLADGQTVAIDMLFAPDSHLLETSKLWDFIRRNKHQFLSRKSEAFVGYCRQQANKYGIKGSRVAAAKRAAELFEWARIAYSDQTKVGDLSGEFVVKHDILFNEHTRIVEQPINKAGDVGKFYECCNRKVGFNNTVKEAHNIFARIYENYGARARQAQSNEGVDWKALSHAVRVGNEALELLTTGNVTLPLPNAAHVLDVKLGRIPYQEVADEIEQLLLDVELAAETSDLPDTANLKFIDDMVYDEYAERVLQEEFCELY